MALGFEGYNYARALGRKRVVVSNHVEASNQGVTPLKRVCSGRFTSISDRSYLESLPFDVLIKVLCCVDHEDLEQLFNVSKTIREATEIAKRMHFEYSTPKKKTFAAFHTTIDVDDDPNGFNGIKTPNAPLRKSRSRLKGRNLDSVSANLFPSMDEEY